MVNKSHRQSSLMGYSPWGHKRVKLNLVTKPQQHIQRRVDKVYIRENKNIAGYCEILEIHPAIWLSRLEQTHGDFYFLKLIYLF